MSEFDEMTKARLLARRSARLVQLMGDGVPDVIIQNEVRLITEALAMIRGRPRRLLWAMRWQELRWERLARRDRALFERDAALPENDGLTPEEWLQRRD